MTELEHLQAELATEQQKNKMLNAILDAIPVDIFVKDPDDEFRYIYCNKSFYDTQGSGRQVLGKNDYEVFKDDFDANHLRRDDQYTLQNGGNNMYQEPYVDRSGVSHLLYTIKKPLNIDGRETPLLLGSSIDEQEMPLVRENLKKARKEVERIVTLQRVFLRSISHEVRTPLNAIQGFVGLLRDCESSAEREEYVNLVTDNVTGLLSMIDNVILLSKLGSGMVPLRYSYVNITEMMHTIEQSFRSKAEQKGLKLTFQQPFNETVAKVENTLLQQVVTQLIDNALKFTERGEVIVRYDLDSTKSQLIFSVTDTGIGIDKDEQQKVFRPFFKHNNYTPGSGTGLAVCSAVAELLHGSITLQSELGTGSTFTLTIPFERIDNSDSSNWWF